MNKKIILTKKFYTQKFFWPLIFSTSVFFIQNFFQPQFLDPKNIFTPKFSLTSFFFADCLTYLRIQWDYIILLTCSLENVSLILLARSLIENLGINLLARSLIGKYLPYSARSLAQWRKLAFSTQKNVNPIFFWPNGFLTPQKIWPKKLFLQKNLYPKFILTQKNFILNFF